MRYLTAIILVIIAAAGLGWHNHRKLAGLREEHRKLAGLAASRGILPATGNLIETPRITKRPREDRAAEARRVTADFIAYAKDMHAVGRNPDKATRQRMMEQMDEVMSLDAEQLKILIGEIRDAPGMDDYVQLDLLRFSLERLIQDRPQDALALLTPEMTTLIGRHTSGVVENLTSSAFTGWAKINATAALEWYRENRDKISENVRSFAESALIRGVADSDPRLALKLNDEFGNDLADTVPWIIGRDGQTPVEKLASLAALRELGPTIPDLKTREKVFFESLEKLVLGNTSGSADFQTVSKWIADAKLTDDEMALFVRRDLLDFSYYVKPAETGKWAEWLIGNFPAEAAEDQIWNIFTKWTGGDYKAAGEWLVTASDGPAKTTAIRAYADRLAKTDPETAMQWLVTLPPGRAREDSFRWLYRDWPKKEPAAREAAEAFAREHGIK